MSDTSQTVVEAGAQDDANDRLDRAQRSLPRRRFFSEMPDKGLFALVAVGGFVAIMALKLRNFDARMIAGGAVAAMVAYGFLAYQIPRVQMRMDRLGDNFYYLGFIFTLASMSAALIQLNDSVTQIDDLIGSFGIALFTTIVGVAGRVLFVQMRSEIDDIEDVVRRNLISASHDLRAQLSLSLREFEIFRKSTQQTATEALKGATRVGEDQNERLVKTAEDAATRIQRAFEKGEASAQKLGVAADKIADTAEQFSRRLTELEVPGDRLHRHLDAFTNELRALIARLGGTLDMLVAGAMERRSGRRWYWPFHRRS